MEFISTTYYYRGCAADITSLLGKNSRTQWFTYYTGPRNKSRRQRRAHILSTRIHYSRFLSKKSSSSQKSLYYYAIIVIKILIEDSHVDPKVRRNTSRSWTVISTSLVLIVGSSTPIHTMKWPFFSKSAVLFLFLSHYQCVTSISISTRVKVSHANSHLCIVERCVISIIDRT